MAMFLEPTYVVEVIAERYDFLTPENRDKTLIHELMHIPKSFRGGFRHHKNFVTDEKVEIWYKRFLQKLKETGQK